MIAAALLVGWALGALSIVIALALVAWWLSAEGEAWADHENASCPSLAALDARALDLLERLVQG